MTRSKRGAASSWTRCWLLSPSDADNERRDISAEELAAAERAATRATNPFERIVRRIDVTQQAHRPLAFAFGVFKKFGDDRGSSLAALLSYYGFLALFPLLLLLVTLLGVILNRDVKFQHRVLNSALREFPIIGDQLGRNIHSLRAHGLGIALGIAGLVWGALGIAQIGQHAMAQVWNVPGVNRPGFGTRLLRSLMLLGVIGLGAILSTAVTGLGASGHRGIVVRILQLALSSGINVGLFILGFRVLTPRQIPGRDLILGAALAGLAWTALQTLGGYLVSHQLRHASQVYGLFGIVLGLLSFLALTATLSLYAAELNVVRVRHLWPRSIVQPPLTSGDKQVLSDIAEQEERRPEQTVEVTYADESPRPAD